eukprot:67557-Hanusia_phi.AAC.1
MQEPRLQTPRAKIFNSETLEALGEDNRGFAMLRRMGWDGQTGMGAQVSPLLVWSILPHSSHHVPGARSLRAHLAPGSASPPLVLSLIVAFRLETEDWD